MHNKRARGVVTWSPVVVSVNRPSRKQSRKKRLTRSVVSVGDRRIEGTIDAHFRGDTHSLLLSMREHGHRTLQLLIDLPKKQVRRIYDGQTSFNVRSDGQPCALKCILGNIVWEDGEVRDMDARGFRLDWLNGMHSMTVEIAKRNETTRPHRRCGHSQLAYRASRHRVRSSGTRGRGKLADVRRACLRRTTNRYTKATR